MFTIEQIRSLISALPTMGFLTAYVALNEMLGLPTRQAAAYLFNGKQVSYLSMMIHKINSEVHCNLLPEFLPLLQEARVYILPDSLKRDYDALCACLGEKRRELRRSRVG